MENHLETSQLNFVIAAPAFSYSSGGTIVLYDLARIITNQGIRCNIFDISRSNLSNDIFDSYVVAADFNDYTVAIYPEIIAGNPLRAKYVVRWILFELGINCPHDIYKTWGKDDFVYHYGSFNSDKGSSQYNLLFPLTLSPQLINQGKPKKGYCHVIRKGPKIHQPLNYIHPSDSLFLDENLSRHELIEILNTKEYLISYDPFCYIICMAALCGCVSIVLPLKDVSKEQWLNASPFLLILEKSGQKDLNGVAYGLEEVEYARNTLGDVRHQHEMFMEFGEKTVKLFINDMESVVDTGLEREVSFKNSSVLNVEGVFCGSQPKYTSFKRLKWLQLVEAAELSYHACNLRLYPQSLLLSVNHYLRLSVINIYLSIKKLQGILLRH